MRCPPEEQPRRTTKIMLAAAHLDHDPAHCQLCYLLHDRPEYRRRIGLTLRGRKALGDLFSCVHPASRTA